MKPDYVQWCILSVLADLYEMPVMEACDLLHRIFRLERAAYQAAFARE